MSPSSPRSMKQDDALLDTAAQGRIKIKWSESEDLPARSGAGNSGRFSSGNIAAARSSSGSSLLRSPRRVQEDINAINASVTGRRPSGRTGSPRLGAEGDEGGLRVQNGVFESSATRHWVVRMNAVGSRQGTVATSVLDPPDPGPPAPPPPERALEDQM